jgi:universal stress protein E
MLVDTLVERTEETVDRTSKPPKNRSEVLRTKPAAHAFKKVMLLAGGKGKHIAAAQERALSIAEYSQASLTVLHVFPRVSPRQEQYVPFDEGRDLARTHGIEYSSLVRVGMAYQEVKDELLRSDYDLVITGSAEPWTLKDVVVGNTHRRLIRDCSSPVWIVRYRPHSLSGRIVVALDADPHDDDRTALAAQLLRVSSAIAGWDNSEVHIANVAWSFSDYLRALHAGFSVEQANDLEKEFRSEQHRSLDRLLWGMNIAPGTLHTHLLQGNTVQAVATLVSHLDADLLVIGSVGRSGLAGLLIGNTAEKVMRQVNCSTLVIKPAVQSSMKQRGVGRTF